VIELRPQRAKTRFDVAQAFAKRKLREGQAEKLIAARKAAWPTLTTVT
jgi:hypothetical protein